MTPSNTPYALLLVISHHCGLRAAGLIPRRFARLASGVFYDVITF